MKRLISIIFFFTLLTQSYGQGLTIASKTVLHKIGVRSLFAGEQSGFRLIQLSEKNLSDNSAFGYYTLGALENGNYNTVLGSYAAGSLLNTSGTVWIGYNAGNNPVFDSIDNIGGIDNSNTSCPLIFFDFANDTVKICGSLMVDGSLIVGSDTISQYWDKTNGHLFPADGVDTVYAKILHTDTITSLTTGGLISSLFYADPPYQTHYVGDGDLNFYLDGTGYDIQIGDSTIQHNYLDGDPSDSLHVFGYVTNVTEATDTYVEVTIYTAYLIDDPFGGGDSYVDKVWINRYATGTQTIVVNDNLQVEDQLFVPNMDAGVKSRITYYDDITGQLTHGSDTISHADTALYYNESDPYFTADVRDSVLAISQEQWSLMYADTSRHSLYSDSSGYAPTNDTVWNYINDVIAQHVFDPDYATLTAGSQISGTVDSCDYHDEALWTLGEAVGVPGFDIEVIFDSVDHIPNRLTFHGYYEGSSTHEITLAMWDYVDSDWEVYTTLFDRTSMEWIEVSIPDPAEHIQNDSCKVRFYHSASGNTSHRLYIDYLVLSTMGFGSSSDHSTLTNLTADDHTQYALLAGRAGDKQWIDTLRVNTPTNSLSPFAYQLDVNGYTRLFDETSGFGVLDLSSDYTNSIVTDATSMALNSPSFQLNLYDNKLFSGIDLTTELGDSTYRWNKLWTSKITDNGTYVGINDNSPEYPLDVTGTIRATVGYCMKSDASITFAPIGPKSLKIEVPTAGTILFNVDGGTVTYGMSKFGMYGTSYLGTSGVKWRKLYTTNITDDSTNILLNVPIRTSDTILTIDNDTIGKMVLTIPETNWDTLSGYATLDTLDYYQQDADTNSWDATRYWVNSQGFVDETGTNLQYSVPYFNDDNTITSNRFLRYQNRTLEIGTQYSGIDHTLFLWGYDAYGIAIKAPPLPDLWTLTLPATNGNPGEYLMTNGNGVTSWDSVPEANFDTLSNYAVLDTLAYYQLNSDTNTVDATRYWVGQQGYLTTEQDSVIGNEGDTSKYVTDGFGIKDFAYNQTQDATVEVDTTEITTWHDVDSLINAANIDTGYFKRLDNYVTLKTQSDSVGLGTDNPRTKLDVIGEFSLTGQTNSIIYDVDSNELIRINHEGFNFPSLSSHVDIGLEGADSYGVGKLNVISYTDNQFGFANFSDTRLSGRTSKSGNELYTSVITTDTTPVLFYLVFADWPHGSNDFGTLAVTVANYSGMTQVNFSIHNNVNDLNVVDSSAVIRTGVLWDSLFVASPRLSTSFDSILIPVYSRIESEILQKLSLKVEYFNGESNVFGIDINTSKSTSVVTTWIDKVNKYAIDSARTSYVIYYDPTTGVSTYDSIVSGGAADGDSLWNHIVLQDIDMTGFDLIDPDTIFYKPYETSFVAAEDNIIIWDSTKNTIAGVSLTDLTSVLPLGDYQLYSDTNTVDATKYYVDSVNMFHQEDGAVEMKDNTVLRIDAGDVLSFVNNVGDSTKIYQAGESFVIQPQNTVDFTQIYSDVYIGGDTVILNEMTKAKKAHNVFYDEVSGVLTYGDTTAVSAEVDGSVTNEGSLTVEAGGANSAEIHSNTSGSTDVTIKGGDNIAITENTGTGIITISSTSTREKTIINPVTVDGDWSGDAIYLPFNTTDGTISFGDLLYLNTSGRVALTDADATTTMACIGMALETKSTGSGTILVLLKGTVRNTAWSIASIGNGKPLVVSTTAGAMSVTAPSGDGDIVQVVGVVLDATNEVIYFNPDYTIIELDIP